MTPRERVKAALNHREPDRVPVDMGSTTFTGIHWEAYRRLKEYLGIQTLGDEKIIKRSGVVIPEEEVLEKLCVDTRPVLLGPTEKNINIANEEIFEDEWGVSWRKSKQSQNYSLHKSPFEQEMNLDAIESYNWPNPDNSVLIRQTLEKARRLHEETDYAVVLHYSADVVLRAQYMRGFEGWFTDLVDEPHLAKRLLNKTLDYWLQLGNILLPKIAPYVDVVTVVDDIADNKGLLISPSLYEEFVGDYYQKIISLIKDTTDAKVLFHCCGAVFALIENFIAMGIDALNPIQVSAEGMDTRELKKTFGNRISFWGAISAHILAFGNPRDVKKEVRKRLEDLAEGGGYVLSAVHNIQPVVPPQNICAMFEAALEYGQY